MPQPARSALRRLPQCNGLLASLPLLLLCLGLAACAGTPGAALAPAGPALLPSLSGALPPLPPARAVSLATAPYLSGADSSSKSPSAAPFGAAMTLDATVAGPLPQWALYYLNPGGNWDTVSIQFDAAPAAWIARGNYATGRWDLAGPYAGGASLPATADYRSPDGGLWIAVLAPVGSTARVYALTTTAPSGSNLAPTAALQADVTSGTVPFTVNFDAGASADPDGSIIQYAWDFDGNATFDEYTSTAQASHVYPAAGDFNASVLVLDNQFLPNSVSVGISANALPLIQLDANKQAAAPGAALELDASGSDTGGGFIVVYDWDLDGDGVFSEPGAETAAQNSTHVATTFPAEPGNFSIGVRVTDDDLATAVATVDLTAQGWLKLTIDSDAPPGPTNRLSSQTSLALIGGKPAVSYRDNGTLRYAWSTAADGSTGWSDVEVDAVSTPGQTSLASIGGKPAICYDGADLLGSTEVRYAMSTAADGSTGWSDQLLRADGGYDLSIALAEIGGLPAVAYMEDTMGKLVYCRNPQADGSGVWTFSEQFVGIGALSQLTAVAGNPALGLYDGKLSFARSATADGSGPWSKLDADAAVNVGAYLSLAVITGHPAVSHCHSGTDDLRYSWSTSVDGASGWSSVEVDSAGNGGGATWLATVGGFPAICYHDAGHDTLKFARSTQADGSSGWSSSTVDTGAGVFMSGALLAGGQPAVAYYDTVNSDLKYAVLFE